MSRDGAASSCAQGYALSYRSISPELVRSATSERSLAHEIVGKITSRKNAMEGLLRLQFDAVITTTKRSAGNTRIKLPPSPDAYMPG